MRLLAGAQSPVRPGLWPPLQAALPSPRGRIFRGRLAALASPSEAGVLQAPCVGSRHPPTPTPAAS